MKALILCGGLGTRLRTIVSDRPKSMAIIQGKPFLEHLMNYWSVQGINSFVLLTGYMHDAIENYFRDEYNGYRLEYSRRKSK